MNCFRTIIYDNVQHTTHTKYRWPKVRQVSYRYAIHLGWALSHISCDNVEEERLAVWNSLMTTVVYMGEKYNARATPFWRAVQSSSFDNLDDILSEANCCADTGFELQVNRLVRNIDAAERDRTIEELKIVPPVISKALQNCADNDIVGRFFSVIRWVGLKRPFRPCRLSTLDRELCDRFYLQHQSERFRAMMKETAVTIRTTGI